MCELAPIGVSTYTRLSHLKKTIAALQANTLAKHSRLFVFSDGAKPGDEEEVKKLREYLHTIDGFKEVTIIERQKNSRIINNRGGIQQLLGECGKCIFLEEDVVTAPGFLSFINQGLDYYKDNKNVFSIGGHTPNLKLYKSYKNDVYFIDRFHGWGFGIWKDRYDSIKYIPENYYNHKDTLTRLQNMGGDMLPMVKLDAERKIDALDIKACYLMASKQMVNVLPVQTLVKNIGLDGTGTHCKNHDMYASDLLSPKSEFRFFNYIKIDKKIKKQHRLFYTESYTDKVIRKLRTLIKK